MTIVFSKTKPGIQNVHGIGRYSALTGDQSDWAKGASSARKQPDRATDAAPLADYTSSVAGTALPAYCSSFLCSVLRLIPSRSAAVTLTSSH